VVGSIEGRLMCIRNVVGRNCCMKEAWTDLGTEKGGGKGLCVVGGMDGRNHWW